MAGTETPAARPQSRAGMWVGLGVIAFCVAVIVFISTHRKPSPVIANPNDVEQVQLGKLVYQQNCARCHGKNLQGETSDWQRAKADGFMPAPPLDATGQSWENTERVLFRIIKLGANVVIGPAIQTKMKPYDGILSDKEIWAVVAYIKTHWNDEQRRREEEMTRNEP